MLTGKKIIIFGAGVNGKSALLHYGSRNVKCFADNNKAGGMYCGKDVISLGELFKVKSQYDLVIAVGYKLKAEVTDQLLTAGIEKFDYFRIQDEYESDPRIAAFKDIHKNKRCFIIGNGPSLKAEDLDVLHRNGEISFGCNRIYKIFDSTQWRPDFFAVVADRLLQIDMEILLSVPVKNRFFRKMVEYGNYGEYIPHERCAADTYFYNYESQTTEEGINGFSKDPSRCVYSGSSVIYTLLQLAAYMGFSEMFLLGVDNNYSRNPKFELAGSDANHFSVNYVDEAWNGSILDQEPNYLNETQRITFIAAKYHSEKLGFKIYNATRGGKLDVFERVDFDSLF